MNLSDFRFPLLFVLCLLASPAVFAESPRRPRIALNMTIPEAHDTTASSVNLSLRSTYVDAVLAAGGLPLLVPPVNDLSVVGQYADLADGFVFVGGPDINPARFGEEPHPTVRLIHPRREEFDFALMARTLETSKPILGICLGMQMLHVAHGGSMIQDIPSLAPGPVNHRPEQPGTELAHPVEILPGTRLMSIVSTTTLQVNSIHHQACVIGPDSPFAVAARAPDGIVEAIEAPGPRFLMGVQWHPEFLADSPDPAHLRLFQTLVKEAAQTADFTATKSK